MRNRIYEILDILAYCDDAVDLVGISGYFNLFDDFVHRPSAEIAMPVLSNDERAIVLEVAELLEAACAATPDFTRAEFVDSGWPRQIAPKARDARSLFLRRGLFSEEFEEYEPGQPAVVPAGR
ncbi:MULTISPECIES: hypothetical protein [unclassified Mesorhizobium]|uniref:hypothetical protein n=1 Tax=unclassified Mesorhizobium TaxID=325217 RepID=UPI0033361A1F